MYLKHGNRFGHTRMVLLGNVCEVKASFGPFLDCVRLSRKIGSWFATNVPRAWKSFSAHPMVLRGVVSHVEACFGAFGGSVTLGTRWVHGLRRMYLGHGNHFGHTR